MKVQTMLLLFPVAVDEDRRRIFIARLRRAIELAGLTEQQACSEMCLRQNQWSAQCAGQEHLSFTRLALLPTKVHCWFGLLLLIDCGLPIEVATFLELFTRRTKVAKMLPAHEDKPEQERRKA